MTRRQLKLKTANRWVGQAAFAACLQQTCLHQILPAPNQLRPGPTL